jgi:acetyl esterase/lipase
MTPATGVDGVIARFTALTGGWTAATPLEVLRPEFEAFFTSYPVVEQTRLVASTAPLAGEWVAAPGADERNVILLLHGGGFMLGSARAHRAYASHLSASTGAWVLSLDYRLAPEHPFPAALDDAVAAVTVLRARAVAPARLMLCGDSAGGGLALATALALRDAGAALPDGCILVSPWVDLTCSGASYAQLANVDPIATRAGALDMAAAYLAGADPAQPLASPLFADLHGLPPILILAGEREIFLDDARALAARLHQAGGQAELTLFAGAIHQFPLHVGAIAAADEALALIGKFVRAVEKPMS